MRPGTVVLPSAQQVSSNFSCIDSNQTVPNHQTQTSSHQLSGDDLCNKGTGLVLEIFAGTCRLSKACRGLGLQALSVDKDVKRAENAVVARYDLCDTEQFATLEKLVRSERHRLVHAHFAPSCGTASRARERPVPGLPKDRQPRPLRSEDMPDGLSGLSVAEEARVQAANASYNAAVGLIVILLELGVSISIENPKNSLFWLTSMMTRLYNMVPQGHFTVFHSCMHGGQRDKATKFWSFNPRDPTTNMFATLALECDKKHVHQSWRPRFLDGKWIYPTKEEAAYPLLLCVRMASLFLQEAYVRGLGPDEDLVQQLQHDGSVGKRQIFTTQPRQQKLRPAISEFGYVLHVAVNLEEAPMFAVGNLCPKGSKILARQVEQGFKRDVFMAMVNPKMASNVQEGETFELLKIGVPREPQQFIEAAVALGHPRFLLARVNNEASEAIDYLLGDAANLSLTRMAFLKKWLNRAKELQRDEAVLHSQLPDHLRSVLGGKRILLWKEILEDLGYADAKIMDEVIQGFPMTGWAKESGVFQPDVRPPELTVKQLKGIALGLNHAVVDSLMQAEVSELDAPAWEETQTEIDNGWLVPCEVADLRTVHVAKRFPLQQGGKLRLIDDFTAAGVNQTVGLAEKLRVESVDELAANILVAMKRGTGQAISRLVGRTFDLKSAYKQFGVDLEHQQSLRIAQKHPDGGVKFFAVQSLPFGATASVSSFLRLAASIKYIGTVGLHLVWTNFFDDYTAICTAQSAPEVTFCVESLLKLLGVRFAETGPKAPDFDEKFKTLGLVVDLTSSAEGEFKLGHTEKRTTELLASLNDLIKTDRVEVKELERLHGRLVWFNSYIFGRELNSAVRVVSRHARMKSKTIVKTEELTKALHCLVDELTRARPVQVSTSHCDTYYVFTDGAYEPTSETPGTIGGLLVDQWGRSLEFFGLALPQSLLNQFLELSDHPIYELELLPTLVALRVWTEQLRGCHVVFYLDNTPAHSALVRADGATGIAMGITKEFVKYEKILGLLPWFGRVPSISNPADDASRLNFQVPWLANAKHRHVVLPEHLSQWGIQTGAPETKDRKT